MNQQIYQVGQRDNWDNNSSIIGINKKFLLLVNNFIYINIYIYQSCCCLLLFIKLDLLSLVLTVIPSK